jgi:small conductance mechanosensitive channel
MRGAICVTLRAMQAQRRLARRWRTLIGAAAAALFLHCGSAEAQDAEATPPTPISAVSDAQTDAQIRNRLTRIYAQIDAFSRLRVSVTDGVVTIEGTTLDQTTAQDAADIARRIEGVVAVQDNTTGSVDVGEKVSPFFERLSDMTIAARDATPLLLLALTVFAMITALGWLAASRKRFWRRLSPNLFISDLLAQAVRAIAIIVGAIVALNLVGANALLGTVLGGAGVLGLAIGFAVRDSLENYISSVMLSVRQPFRANDHVVIDGNEGKVVRLTSRATVLMTLDGNHLRIPNATVFKAVILNYTRNPERRFTFELGVDAADDPQAAIETGAAAIAELDFVIDDPPPSGIIESVGESNIVLSFRGWVNQNGVDFLRARSVAIRCTKMALEAAGFTLPEPIYRLRVDQLPAGSAAKPENAPAPRPQRPRPAARETSSVAPEGYLDEKIAAERQQTSEEDLLNNARPIE